MIRIIHFCQSATNPVEGFCAHGVRCVTLADGAGADETYVSCLHIEPGGWILDPPALRDTALLVVHGVVRIWFQDPTLRCNLSCGMGVVVTTDQR